jgi:ATP-dependent Clp protease protease subunit
MRGVLERFRSWLRPSARAPAEEDSSAGQDALVADRIVELRGAIEDRTATETIAKLLFLADRDPRRTISLHIDSPGGFLTAGIAVLDAIADLPVPVSTLCLARADGVAALLLAAGAPGLRFAMPNATVLLTGVEAGARGLAHLNEGFDRAFLRLERLTGQTRRTLEELAASARPLNAQAAKALGFVDAIIAVHPPV